MASGRDGGLHPNEVSRRVIGAAIAVHRELGPGLLESSYGSCLAMEMTDQGLAFTREKRLPVRYKDRFIDCHYRLDFLVEDQLVVEIKCVERFEPIHTAQMLTYLRLTGCSLGLLINFNVRVLKGGIRRVVRGLPESRPLELPARDWR